VKKYLLIPIATFALLAPLFVNAPPSQAASSEASDSVSLRAVTNADVAFNAIAVWNPIKHSACLYDSANLSAPTTSAEPWVTPGDCRTWVPPSLTPSGIYAVTWDSGKSKALLVTSAEPSISKRNHILVIVPDYTWQAYDLVKNGNFYFEEVGKKSTSFSARQLNLLRPMNFSVVGDPVNYPSAVQLYPAANPIQFLRSHLNNVDVVSQSNLDEYTYDLSTYQTLVLYGHDEYWTAKEKTGLERAVSEGASLLNLSGNTGYRKLIRTGNLIGFETPTVEHPKTSIWGDLPGDSTVLKLIGAEYLGEPFDKRQAKPVRVSPRTLQALIKDGLPEVVKRRNIHFTLRGMMVKDASNGLFTGTGLKNGDFFGMSSGVMTIELDGIPESSSGAFESSFFDKFGQTPISAAADSWANARQSGPTRAWRVGQLIQTKFGLGKVFTAGPIGWTRALVLGDQKIERITLNALKYLGQEPLG
jgi:hypothetical protein